MDQQTIYKYRMSDAEKELNEFLTNFDPSLVNIGNKSTEKGRWKNLLAIKEQDLVDYGISVKSIALTMRQRELNATMISHYENCAKLSTVYECPNCGEKEYTPAHCDNRLCQVCEDRRLRRIKHKYFKEISKMRNPKFITLTIGKIPVIEGEIISYWRKKIYRLLRAFGHKEKKKIRSGFIVMEISRYWFLHAHCIIDTPYFIPQKTLSQKWLKISGRYIADIKRATPRAAMKYLIKYVVKPPEFNSTNDYVNYLIITKKRRLFSTIGTLYKQKQEITRKTELRCQKCGYEMEHIVSWCYVEHWFMIQDYGRMEEVP